MESNFARARKDHSSLGLIADTTLMAYSSVFSNGTFISIRCRGYHLSRTGKLTLPITRSPATVTFIRSSKRTQWSAGLPQDHV